MDAEELVAVLDASGAVYDVVRRACPDVAVRSFGDREWPTTESRPALAIVAIYGPPDWLRVEACAQVIPTLAVSMASDATTDADRAWRAGAVGQLHVGLPAEAMRRAIVGALRGESAYSRAAVGEHIKAELMAARSRSA